MNDNYAMGRMISLFSYLIQGISAFIVAMIVGCENKKMIALSAVVWAVGYVIIVSLKKDSKFGRNVFCLSNFFISMLLAIEYCIMFRSANIIFLMIFIQWMVYIFFLNKTILVYIYVTHVITVIVLWHIRKMDFFSTYDRVVMVSALISLSLAFWIVLKLIDVISLQNKQSKEQEQSLDDLLGVLEEKCDEALSASVAKSTFLANMSHEIRTPINAILGYNKMIERETRDTNIRGYASKIDGAGNNLLFLINEILDISKIESGKMVIVPAEYDIADVIRDVVNIIRPKADAKSLEIKLELDEMIPRTLKGDDIRIKQILINLLNNAVKYTEKGSVTLKINCIKADGEANLTFSVIDTGIGIREEDIDKLYEKFERIDLERNRNIEGTGLGINITVNLLRMMGSTLKVKSRYGYGSTFYFELNQDVVDSTLMPEINLNDVKNDIEEYCASFIAPDARLLVVDDNDINRDIAIGLLKDNKIRVDGAESGFKCIELVAKNKYDIILMDHMMPQMDGVETMQRLKEMDNNASADAKIIVLTANAISGAREKYINEGFDDYLSKPIDSEKLEATIRKNLPPDLIMSVSGITGKKEKVELPEIMGLDTKYALFRMKDEKVILDSMRKFYQSSTIVSDELGALYEELEKEQNPENFDAYRIKIHALKSTAAAIGGTTVSEIAKILEFAARDGDFSKIQLFEPVFLEYFNGLIEQMEEVFGTKEEDKEEFDADNLFMYMEMLRTMLKAGSIEGVDSIMDIILKMSCPENISEQILNLQKATLNFDVKLCEEYIEKITALI